LIMFGWSYFGRTKPNPHFHTLESYLRTALQGRITT